MHYARLVKTGTTGSAAPRQCGVEWHLTRYRENENGCWIWQGPVDVFGYGKAKDENHRALSAHLLFYRHHVGPVPGGLELDHTCHTNDLNCPGELGCPHRLCVNPAHLEPVTHAENVARGRKHLRVGDLCRGIGRHLITQESDIRVKSGGVRVCLACYESNKRRAIAKRSRQRAARRAAKA